MKNIYFLGDWYFQEERITRPFLQRGVVELDGTGAAHERICSAHKFASCEADPPKLECKRLLPSHSLAMLGSDPKVGRPLD